MLFQLKDDVLYVKVPERKIVGDLYDFTEQAKTEIENLVKDGNIEGKNLKIMGRLPTAIAMLIGRDIVPLCKSVSIFDVRTKTFAKYIEN